MVPEKNVFALRSQYKYITDFISLKLDQPVTLTVSADYREAVSQLAAGKADAAFLGSFTYIMAKNEVGVEPLARPVWLDERTFCRGYLIARKNEQMDTVAGMAGKRLVMVDPASSSGYFFPLFYLRNSGVATLEKHFEKIIYAGSHDTAIWSVYLGEADIGAAKDSVFNSMSQENQDLADTLTVIARSSRLPTNCFVVRPDLDSLFKDRLRFILLHMDKTTDGKKALALFGGRQFVETTDADFESLRDMLGEVKMNYPRWVE